MTGSHQARRPYLDLQSPLRGSRLGESRGTQRRRRRRRRRRRSVALFHSFPANQVLSIRGERQRGVEERATAEVSAMVIRLCHFMSQCPWSSYLCWSYVSTQVESHFQGLVVLGNASFRLTSTSLLSFVVVKVVINIHEGRVLTTDDMRKWEWKDKFTDLVVFTFPATRLVALFLIKTVIASSQTWLTLIST